MQPAKSAIPEAYQNLLPSRLEALNFPRFSVPRKKLRLVRLFLLSCWRFSFNFEEHLIASAGKIGRISNLIVCIQIYDAWTCRRRKGCDKEKIEWQCICFSLRNFLLGFVEIWEILPRLRESDFFFASNDREFLYHFNGIFCRPADRPSKIKILFKTDAKAGDIFLPTHAVVIQHFLWKRQNKKSFLCFNKTTGTFFLNIFYSKLCSALHVQRDY